MLSYLGPTTERNRPMNPDSTTQMQPPSSGTSRRGFASMDKEKQREIASKGGKAAHEKGTAHEFTPEEAREAGHKGGEAVSQDREHMSEIGREGGEAVSQDREHMSEIGRKGGEHSHGGTTEQHREAGHKGGEHSHGGTTEQHREAGKQSHKNDR